MLLNSAIDSLRDRATSVGRLSEVSISSSTELRLADLGLLRGERLRRLTAELWDRSTSPSSPPGETGASVKKCTPCCGINDRRSRLTSSLTRMLVA